MMLGVFHLVFAFNHTLHLVVLHQEATVHGGSVRLNDSQLSMLQTLRKHALLGTLLILTNICVFFVGVFGDNNTVSEIQENEHSALWAVWTLNLWINVCCVNGVSLFMYLGFAVNRKWYDCLCGKGDRTCDQMCTYCTTKKIETSHYALMTDSAM